MRVKKTTVTVQLDVQYDSGYVEISDISADLRKRLAQFQEVRPHRSPANESSWWTCTVRTFDYATEPIGFEGISTSFDHIGDALDDYDDNKIGTAEFISRVREQVGEREANR